jgi:hypothetical protein
MKTHSSVLRRALTLGENAKSWGDIQAQLIKEGFSHSELHWLSSPIVMRQLLAKMGTSHA